MRESAQDAMRTENEKQLAELAQLQLKCRQQRHEEQSRTLRQPAYVDPQVKSQNQEKVKQLRDDTESTQRQLELLLCGGTSGSTDTIMQLRADTASAAAMRQTTESTAREAAEAPSTFPSGGR